MRRRIENLSYVGACDLCEQSADAGLHLRVDASGKAVVFCVECARSVARWAARHEEATRIAAAARTAKLRKAST